ncbi:MAG: RNase adapter RapZ [Gammaproteobacteria bacterium]|nr:RNase adapter RapZ [Gammaproteobacteria bacterium]
MKFVVVTGLSGSGKSVALNTLEDLGFYCIDNLPSFLLESLADALIGEHAPRFQETAVGIDARNPAEDLRGVPPVVRRLREAGIAAEVVFLEADDDVLVQRFSETRRRHPLTNAETGLGQAIRREREMLEPFLSSADLRIDTTRTNLHDLRDLMRRRVAERPRGEMSILFESFGFKRGAPRDADLVFDARCLPNPHWQPHLRPLTGRDAEVAGFLERDPRVPDLLEDITRFLERWIPCFRDEGRSYLTVAVGCTGGQHRSVYLVERLAAHFRAREPRVLLIHRELP